ncbi:MAG TPA: TetR/AcrR family transcriptional regulator [Actinocatenispora sp.]
MTVGLRELKKQQTRQAISDTATRLFLKNGFEAVTISEIAAAAQVAKMTVTNYFPRKEDLALDVHETFAAGLADAVTARPTGESALAAVRRDILAAIDRHDPVAGFSGTDFVRMITASPTLTTRLRDLHDQREQALAQVLAADPAANDNPEAPRIVAALLGAASRTLFWQIMDLTLDGRSNEDIATTVTRSAHHAFGLLEPALAGYAVRA